MLARAVAGCAVLLALEAIDPPLLLAALGAPLLLPLVPAAAPSALRLMVEAAADSSPLAPLLTRAVPRARRRGGRGDR